MTGARSSRRTLGRLGATALVVAMVVAVVGTWSAFTATTSNAGSTVDAGTVILSDDDGASTMFTVSNLRPGGTGQRCIRVQYDGTLGARVRLYVSASSGTLRSDLQIGLEAGTGGTSGSCTGFTPSDSRPDASLQSLAIANADFASGTAVGAFTPSGAGQARTYRITYTLPTSATAQAQSASVSLRWEARSLDGAAPVELIPLRGALASSRHNSSWDWGLTIDGMAGTIWSSTTLGGPTGSQWIYVDTGASNPIGGVRLTPRTASGVTLSFPQDFVIQTSPDASTWTTVPGQSYTGYPNPPAADVELTFGSPVTARYVRMLATRFRTDGSQYYFQLGEFRALRG